jgi:hypothetical protein
MRVVLGVIAGFIAWLVAWIGIEKTLSALWPAFGVHQAAFENAVENGGAFSPDATMLAVHVVVGALFSVMAGFLAAVIARGNRRAPFVLGVLLLALGLLKLAMSWAHVPIWYHVAFTAVLMPAAIVGGRLYRSPPAKS